MQDYPFKIEVSGQAVLISDSISNSWRVGDDLKELIEDQTSDLLVARHNIIVSDLLHFANSKAGGSACDDWHSTLGCHSAEESHR